MYCSFYIYDVTFYSKKSFPFSHYLFIYLFIINMGPWVLILFSGL